MNVLLNISLRNLFRQKRRNILLGAAIAFGMCVLIVAHSFNNGISDVLLNKIVVYIFGHINIASSERGNFQNGMIRDKNRFIKIAKATIPDMIKIDEGVGGFGRIIGNGKSDNIALAGIEPSAEFYGWCTVLEGNIKNYENPNIENPIILSKLKAEYLNVKANDILRLRVNNVWGQTQTARLTIVAIVKLENIFMENALYLKMADIKKIMGYRQWEAGALLITLKDPRKAIERADMLHKLFKPGIALIQGSLTLRNNSEAHSNKQIITVFSLNKDDTSIQTFNKRINIITGDIKDLKIKKSILISKQFADENKMNIGAEITLAYKNKYTSAECQETSIIDLKVTAIYNSDSEIQASIAFIQEDNFYPLYYENLPANDKLISEKPTTEISSIISNSSILNSLGREWQLLKRSSTTDELKTKLKETTKNKTKISKTDINTMYESASMILKLENALNIITVSAVILLFFIILIGVINTLRMTVRERTREIGTMRAIGFQKNDVRNIFLLETFFLTLFSCIAGTILAFTVMYSLKKFLYFDTTSFISIFLVNKRMHFVSEFGAIAVFYGLILLIAIITAYFPARRAAKMQPGDALRHI